MIKSSCLCGSEPKFREMWTLKKYAGCSDCISLRRKTHGESKTKLFKLWSGMICRCSVNAYGKNRKNYFEKNITVCKEWSSDFIAFKKWALSNGYREGLSIERVNNKRGYSPSNCSFIPLGDQAKNRSICKKITFDGETMNESEWCRKIGVSSGVVSKRIKRGWSIKRALTKKGMINGKC